MMMLLIIIMVCSSMLLLLMSSTTTTALLLSSPLTLPTKSRANFKVSSSPSTSSLLLFDHDCGVLQRQQQQRQQPSLSVVALRLGSGNNNGGGGSGSSEIDPGLKLVICIMIDVIGVASFAAPGLGETTDVGWAPISALLVNYLFGNGVFTALALLEEISPGLDFIPTATLAWFVENGNTSSSSSSSSSSSTNNNNNNNNNNKQTSSSRRSQAASPPPPASTKRNTKEEDVIDVEIID